MDIINLLKDYEDIICQIEFIRNKIIILKDITENRIKNTNSEKRKTQLFTEFKIDIDEIKNNREIKQKYKDLLKKKGELKEKIYELKNNTNIFIKSNNNDNNLINNSLTNNSIVNTTNNDLTELINKYQKNITQPLITNKKNIKTTLITKSVKKPTTHTIIIGKPKKIENKSKKNLSDLIKSLKMDIDS